MAFRDSLLAAWYAPRITALAALLSPFSWLFGLVAAARRALYRAGVLKSVQSGVPVVVVGNIVVGGAGKTPLVIALAEALISRGRRPGIVSRGHGGAGGTREVRTTDEPAVVGDESLLLAATGCPVWIGRDRSAAVRGLRRANPAVDVVLSDDGLQHYRLARDVEIAVIDASRGLGNGLLLPAGPLREPASRLEDVEAVVQLVVELPAPGVARLPRNFLMTHVSAGFRRLDGEGPPGNPARWPKGAVHALAGTGNPRRFFDLLAAMGIDAIPHAFPDHHRFVPGDLQIDGAQIILMTAKDAVKCSSFVDARCYALDIRAVFDAALVDLVLERIDGRQAA